MIFLLVHSPVYGNLSCFHFFFFFFGLPRAAPMAYGSSQARGLMGEAAASLQRSHGNADSEPCLRPTPQLRATPDL